MVKARKLRLVLFTLAVAATGASAQAAPAGADLVRWLSEKTDLPASQVAIAGPELVYGLEPLGPRSSTGEVIALVRTESLAADSATQRGIRSWEAHLLFDCSKRRLREIRGATYSEGNRKGRPTPDEAADGWITPQADQPAMQLMAAACEPGFAWPLRPYLTTVQPATRASATPPAAAVPTPKSTAEAVATSKPVAGTVEAAAPPPKPDLPPKQAVEAAKPAAPTDTAAHVSVQITRGPSQEGADRALRRARAALGPSAVALTSTIETAQLGSRRRYTAVLGGFPTAEAATEACNRLIKAGQDCFVRNSQPEFRSDDPNPKAASVAAPAAAPQPAPAAIPAGYMVQVARGPSEEGAKRALTAARKALGSKGEGLAATTEASQIGRRRRYTAVLVGFPTAAAATEACNTLIKAGQQCLTRAAAP